MRPVDCVHLLFYLGLSLNKQIPELTVIGAKITVFTENGSIVALDKASNPTASNPQMTDATGRFGFNLHTDRKYYMVASAPGYEDYQSDVFTEQWHVIREDIKMVPEQEQMASHVK